MQQRNDLLLYFRQLIQPETRIGNRVRFARHFVLVDKQVLAIVALHRVAVDEKFLPLQHHRKNVT